MPYHPSKRLPGERASRLGHLDIIENELVKKLLESFESDPIESIQTDAKWNEIPEGPKPLSIIFGVDGSFQIVESDRPPYRRLVYVKTALLKMDFVSLSKLDKDSPHPLMIRDMISDWAVYHATVFPLRHIHVEGKNLYDTIREVIYYSLKDEKLEGEPFETLKWLAYEKWTDKKRNLPSFQCPNCRCDEATLPFDTDKGFCPKCKGEIFLTDYMGFHQDLGEDVAPDKVANAYMLIHELLILFTGIRYLWQTNKELLKECLFIKDGPLYLWSQYAKLVFPIRRFFEFARKQGYPIHLLGQEKSGRFFDHLEIINKGIAGGQYFIPDDSYIKKEIQQRPDIGNPYGERTNFGSKLFVKVNNYHQMVVSIPIGEFKVNPELSDFVGIERIFATIPNILSSKYEGALLPIELAHGIASLSTYPSAKILKIFSESKIS